MIRLGRVAECTLWFVPATNSAKQDNDTSYTRMIHLFSFFIDSTIRARIGDY